MAERYTRLYSLPEKLYTPGAPVVIAAGALLKDNQTGKTLAQIKFKSISEKQIKAVKISVSAFDVAGKELEGVAEYQYLDLTATRNSEFGQKQAVLLPDAVTRSFEAKCTDVVFGDGTVWNALTNAKWLPFPTQASITSQLGDLAAQYQRDTSSKSKFIPLDYEDLWLCSCGEINHNGEYICHSCRNNKEALFAALELETLQQRNADYDQAKAEREKVEAEEAAKKAAADKVKRAKTMKLAAVAVLVVVLALLTTKLIIPTIRYNKALAVMEAGRYQEAEQLFVELGDFKDSEWKSVECYKAHKESEKRSEYNNAIALMDAGEYEKAISAFTALVNYEDSEEKIEECKQAIIDRENLAQYNNAVALMDEGKYEEAIDIFSTLEGCESEVTECNNAILEEKYNDAIGLMESGEFNKAKAAFLKLGDYKDSIDKLAECEKQMIMLAELYETVEFGFYEQDNISNNGKESIQWRVIDVREDKVLLLSEYALDCQPYNSTYTAVTWENCTLREWLNDDFLNIAFSQAEKGIILDETVTADRNPSHDTDPGNATIDKVFVLSVIETEKYLDSDSARQSRATKYAQSKAQGMMYYYGPSGECFGWLRTPGERQNQAIAIDHNGVTGNGKIGRGVDCDYSVRPAMWIDLSEIS